MEVQSYRVKPDVLYLYISKDRGAGIGGRWGEVLDASTWLSEPESTRFLLVWGRIFFFTSLQTYSFSDYRSRICLL